MIISPAVEKYLLNNTLPLVLNEKDMVYKIYKSYLCTKINQKRMFSQHKLLVLNGTILSTKYGKDVNACNLILRHFGERIHKLGYIIIPSLEYSLIRYQTFPCGNVSIPKYWWINEISHQYKLLYEVASFKDAVCNIGENNE